MHMSSIIDDGARWSVCLTAAPAGWPNTHEFLFTRRVAGGALEQLSWPAPVGPVRYWIEGGVSIPDELVRDRLHRARRARRASRFRRGRAARLTPVPGRLTVAELFPITTTSRTIRG